MFAKRGVGEEAGEFEKKKERRERQLNSPRPENMQTNVTTPSVPRTGPYNS